MRLGMMRMAAAGFVLAAGGAARGEERELCPDRPGKDTPACTLDAGKIEIETSLLDDSHSRDARQAEDSWLIGDTLLRYGLDGDTELHLSWTAYGFDRSRDRATGVVDRSSGTGDVTIGLRRNLLHPDGKGTAIALQPFVTAPTGRMPIGQGTWSAGIIAPIGADLAEDWRLTLDPEVEAAADKDGAGRHLAYSMVASVAWSISKAVEVSAEAFARRDEEPGDHQTLASIDAMAAWHLPGGHRQIDIAAYAGLTRATPRIELVLGAVQRF